MKRVPQTLLLALLLASLAATAARAEESPKDILVVANKAVPAANLSLTDLKDIFLARRTSWNGVVKTVPLHPFESSAIRAEFRLKVLQMTKEEEWRHWEKAKIRAGITKPAEFGNPLKAVFSMRGSVSYVYRADFKEGVAKVIAVIPAAP